MKTVVTNSLAVKLGLKNVGTKPLVFPSLMPHGQCFWLSNKPGLPPQNPLPDVVDFPINTQSVAVGGQTNYVIHWDKLFDLKLARKGTYEVVLTFSTMRHKRWTGDAPTEFEASFMLRLEIGDKGQTSLTGPFWPSKR